MTNTVKASVLEDISNNLNVNNRLRTYSGRGMYGSYCPAIEFESLSDAFVFFAALGTYTTEQQEHDEPEVDYDFAERLASGASYDSMGLGVVVYFSRWELDGELSEEDDDY